VEGHDKTFSGSSLRTCAPLSNSFRRHWMLLTHIIN